MKFFLNSSFLLMENPNFLSDSSPEILAFDNAALANVVRSSTRPLWNFTSWTLELRSRHKIYSVISLSMRGELQGYSVYCNVWKSTQNFFHHGWNRFLKFCRIDTSNHGRILPSDVSSLKNFDLVCNKKIDLILSFLSSGGYEVNAILDSPLELYNRSTSLYYMSSIHFYHSTQNFILVFFIVDIGTKHCFLTFTTSPSNVIWCFMWN